MTESGSVFACRGGGKRDKSGDKGLQKDTRIYLEVMVMFILLIVVMASEV